MAIDRNLAAHNSRIASESRFPIRITEDHYRVGAGGFAFGRQDEPPRLRLYSQPAEKVAGNVVGQDAIGFAIDA